MPISPPNKLPQRVVAPSIARREWIVAIMGASTLVFTAWCFTGFQVWAAHTLLAGGLLTFACSILPMPASYNGLDGEHGNRKNYKRLLCLPAFWLSLFFLLYLALQAMNPEGAIFEEEGALYLRKMVPILGTSWPTSLNAPYERINALRVIIVFLAGFSLFWGLWIGLRRRKTVILVLWVFMLSGAAMAFTAILMSLTETNALLWTVPPTNPNFWGTFSYRNHGAAYLNLILVAIGFLFFYHLQKTKNRGHVGGPHLLLFCLFALVASSVAMALSRGGILFGACISVAFFCFAAVYGLRSVFHQRSIWLSLLPALLLATGAFTAFQQINLDAISKRFGDVEATIENADEDYRMLLSLATWDMAQDRMVYGWGAGSFRYYFHRYQKEYPSIYYLTNHPKKGWSGRQFYKYAHNDILQFLAEYGIVGCSFLLLTLASLLWAMLRGIGTNVFSVLMLLVGLVATFSHAFLDFILNAPAYLIAFMGFYAAAAKLVRLESKRRNPQV